METCSLSNHLISSYGFLNIMNLKDSFLLSVFGQSKPFGPIQVHNYTRKPPSIPIKLFASVWSNCVCSCRLTATTLPFSALSRPLTLNEVNQGVTISAWPLPSNRLFHTGWANTSKVSVHQHFWVIFNKPIDIQHWPVQDVQNHDLGASLKDIATLTGSYHGAMLLYKSQHVLRYVVYAL